MSFSDRQMISYSMRLFWVDRNTLRGKITEVDNAGLDIGKQLRKTN